MTYVRVRVGRALVVAAMRHGRTCAAFACMFSLAILDWATVRRRGIRDKLIVDDGHPKYVIVCTDGSEGWRLRRRSFSHRLVSRRVSRR